MLPRSVGIFLATVASALIARGAEPVRLEVRIVAQSGSTAMCVYDDPATPASAPGPPAVAFASVGVARRFEVQYRYVDLVSDPPDAVAPAGLFRARVDVRGSGAAGLWGRAVISAREASGEASVWAVPPLRVDCSGPSPATSSAGYRARGLHQPFRAAIAAPLPGSTADPSESAVNGGFRADGIAGIQVLAAESHGQGDPALGKPLAWFGLYSFEFTPSASGTVVIEAATVADGPGYHHEYFDDGGRVHRSTTPARGAITVRTPAPVTACCSGQRCWIAATPSACFADGGFGAPGGVCDAGSGARCCFGDFNRDGRIGVQDLLEFVIAFQRPSPEADFNSSGSITLQDLFDFLAAYFAGCP